MAGLVKNSVLYLVSTICIKATSFFLLPFYSHLVEPSQYGQIYVVTAISIFLSFLFSLSLASPLQRFYYECKSFKDVQLMYSTVNYTAWGVSIVGFLLLLSFYKELALLVHLDSFYFLIALISTLLGTFYPFILALLYVQRDAVKVSITSIVLGILQIGIQLTLVVCMDDKGKALLYSILANHLNMFIVYIIYSRKYLIWGYNKKALKNYFQYALSQLPSDVSVFLVSSFDRILLNNYKGGSVAGIYGLGNSLGQIPNVMFYSVNKAYVPYVFSLFKRYEEGEGAPVLKEVAKSSLIIFSLLTAVVTAMILFSNNFILLFAPQYKESGIIMVLILIAMLIDCYRIIFMYPMAYNVKYVKIKSLIWILSSGVSVGLNLILIPRFSLYGACCSLLISYSLSCLFIIYFSNKAFPLPYKTKKFGYVIIASLVIFLLLIGGDSISFIPIKIVVYLLYILFLVRTLNIPIIKFMRKKI